MAKLTQKQKTQQTLKLLRDMVSCADVLTEIVKKLEKDSKNQ